MYLFSFLFVSISSPFAFANCEFALYTIRVYTNTLALCMLPGADVSVAVYTKITCASALIVSCLSHFMHG